MGITIDELLVEWRKCDMEEGRLGMTTEEISSELKVSLHTVRGFLKRGIAAGEVENLKELRVNPFRSGTKQWYNVFRMVE